MSSKSLPLGLLALAAVSVPATWLAWRKSDLWSSDTSAAGATLAMPDLSNQESQIARVRLVSSDESLELERSGTGWVLPAKGEYPAKSAEVVGLLRGLADLELVEKKTARPELHERVGLVDPGQAGGTARRVEIFDGEDNTLAELLLGDPAPGAPGSSLFVRKPGEDQTWLAKGEISADTNITEWLERELLKIASDRVQSVQVGFATAAGGYTASREEGTATSFDLDVIPEGKEVSSPWLVSSVARVPSSLRFDDVQTSAEFVVPEGAEASDIAWETFDGVRLRCKAWKLGAADELSEGKVWVTLSAELLEWAGEAPAEPQLPAIGDKITEPVEIEAGPTREELQAEVTDWNLRFEPWVYGVDAQTGDNLFRTLDELVSDIPEPQDESLPAEAAPDFPGLDLPGLEFPAGG